MVSLTKIYKQSNIDCTEKEYKEVCYLFNKKISHRMINDGVKFRLFGNMGVLSIAKNKMKYHKLYFDYAEFNKTGIKSYHLNEHSDGYYAFARWNKKNAVLTNKHYYGFKLTRENTRLVAKVMKSKNGHQIYEIANRKDAI
jgi:hypothetical protein